MGCCLKNLKLFMFICTVGIVFTSCEDDVIIAPKGQQAAGSYGRMSFPDSTKTPEFTHKGNPEVF